MKRRHPIFRDHFTLFAVLAVIGLLAASLLAQGNAHFYAGKTFFQRQTIWIVVGGVVFFAATVIDLRLIERASYLYYGLVLALLVLTLVIGTSPTGEFKRWIKTGFFNIQASEFAKLAVIMALARYLHGQKERLPGEDEPRRGEYRARDLAKPFLIVMVPLLLILPQPDLGTSLMLLFVSVTMLLMEGVHRRATVTALLAVLLVVPVAWKVGLIQPYQQDRIWLWVDQDWDKVDEDTGKVVETRTTQVEQAVWAIGSGGLAGQGHHQGNKARLSKLPEIHTDFIAPMLAEERGFLGVTVLLFLFWGVVMWSLRTAQDSRSRYCRLVAIGIGSLIGWQVFINLGMVSGMLPVVGLPLPMLSYGGSSMIMLMASLGLLFNIAIKRGRL